MIHEEQPIALEEKVTRTICGGVCSYPNCECSPMEQLERLMEARCAIKAIDAEYIGEVAEIEKMIEWPRDVIRDGKGCDKGSIAWACYSAAEKALKVLKSRHTPEKARVFVTTGGDLHDFDDARHRHLSYHWTKQEADDAGKAWVSENWQQRDYAVYEITPGKER